MEWLVGALVGIAILAAVLCVVVVYLRRRYIPGIPNVKLIATVNPEYVSTGECLPAKCSWNVEHLALWMFKVSFRFCLEMLKKENPWENGMSRKIILSGTECEVADRACLTRGGRSHLDQLSDHKAPQGRVRCCD